jgi:hypothetical protein
MNTVNTLNTIKPNGPNKTNFFNLLKFHFKFNHLQNINQTYLQHFRDAFFYSAICFKLAFCFFIHALYPDIFIDSSIELHRLSTLIKMKYTENKIDKENKKNSLFFYFNDNTGSSTMKNLNSI